MDITQKEAASRGLPGHDTYVYRHLIYRDDFSRDIGSARLNVEAYKTFLDTIWISNYRQIAEEIDKASKNISLLHTPGQTPNLWKIVEYQNLENFKISAGFELAFKSILLRKDCIIHFIKGKLSNFENLSKQQSKRPILRQEYFAIDDYRYDAQKIQNRLIGLQGGSIKFSTILEKKDYIDLLDLPEEIINIADNYRNLRNEIHFPNPFSAFELDFNAHNSLTDKIINFINENIVEVNNTIVSQHINVNRNLKNLLLQKL